MLRFSKLIILGLFGAILIGATVVLSRIHHDKPVRPVTPADYAGLLNTLDSRLEAIRPALELDNNKAYLRVMAGAGQACGQLTEKPPGKVDTAKDVFAAHVQQTAEICQQLISITHYSSSVYQGLKPFLEQRLDRTWPSIATDRAKAAGRMAELHESLVTTKSNLAALKSLDDDPGLAEIKTVLERQTEQTTQALHSVKTSPISQAEESKAMAIDSAITAQRDLVSYRRRYWTSLVGLGELSGAVKLQLQAFCDVAASDAPAACPKS